MNDYFQISFKNVFLDIQPFSFDLSCIAERAAV